jgi:hypothetical protein
MSLSSLMDGLSKEPLNVCNVEFLVIMLEIVFLNPYNILIKVIFQFQNYSKYQQSNFIFCMNVSYKKLNAVSPYKLR